MKPTYLLALLLTLACLASADDCKQPLDQPTLDKLSLGWDDVQLHPGDSHQFSLAILSTFAPSQDVPACATWKIEPEGKGATISLTGLLQVDSKTPPRSRFVVTADIEQGRTQRQMGVIVYTNDDQPLVGFWREKSRVECLAQKETTSSQPIQELEFKAKGSFSVTWVPFEVYRDYWGSYTSDNSTGVLSLRIENGNYVPADFRGAGKFKLTDKDTLELTGLYLSEKHAPGQPAATQVSNKCRYVFTRIH
ncbi:MAG TPA: hypothetical protein VI685_09255 [Candidatus Angelobacter sp.]